MFSLSILQRPARFIFWYLPEVIVQAKSPPPPHWSTNEVMEGCHVISTLTDTCSVTGVVFMIGPYTECAKAFSYCIARMFSEPVPIPVHNPITYRGNLIDGWQPETVISSLIKQLI